MFVAVSMRSKFPHSAPVTSGVTSELIVDSGLVACLCLVQCTMQWQCLNLSHGSQMTRRGGNNTQSMSGYRVCPLAEECHQGMKLPVMLC